METISHITIEPPSKASSTVIWLHGLGADGHDFESVLPMLELPIDHAIRFIFPHAPERPITVNDGMVMRGWYDITSFDFGKRGDIEGIESSVESISQLIDKEVESGILPGNILLAGFSQGGVIALHSALRHPQQLAGVMALSTYLPYPEKIPSANNKHPATIFFAHGVNDPVVPYSAGESAKSWLEEKGYIAKWHQYVMEHAVCAEEINEISNFIQGRL
ncbi:MAG: alpha/beta fold hydrolase [Gammaproteobacteria bacterium]|uniref:Alpha/beta fold hydrolase n=1 Tax=Candidatus Thiopontia autotrophica TaxID=2841688 RepID=A0A8J6TMV8_9GAMM|nr:alpha/beta fold hydrolase [Candidatus Thiopontia autotrophica]MBL6969322.1 alpha/beta fold hydrolase [Gammaproteobacteria bacterium]